MNRLTLDEPAIGGFQLTEQEFGLDVMLFMEPYFCFESARMAALRVLCRGENHCNCIADT